MWCVLPRGHKDAEFSQAPINIPHLLTPSSPHLLISLSPQLLNSSSPQLLNFSSPHLPPFFHRSITRFSLHGRLVNECGLVYLRIISEFQGLEYVKRFKSYFLACFLLPAVTLVAQKRPDSPIPASFPDSVRVALEKTRSADAVLVGGNFAASWTTLGADQQAVIQRQVRAMKKKKLPLRPHLSNYFG